jgi:hypothetical protein
MAAKKPSRAKKKRSRGTRTTDPAQYARFLETAKKLGADESGAAFERALDAILPKKGKP